MQLFTLQRGPQSLLPLEQVQAVEPSGHKGPKGGIWPSTQEARTMLAMARANRRMGEFMKARYGVFLGERRLKLEVFVFELGV